MGHSSCKLLGLSSPSPYLSENVGLPVTLDATPIQVAQVQSLGMTTHNLVATLPTVRAFPRVRRAKLESAYASLSRQIRF